MLASSANMKAALAALLRKHRRKIVAIGIVIALPLLAHAIIGQVTRISPPDSPTPRFVATGSEGGALRTVRGWRIMRGVRLVYLAGSPEEIGGQHTALLSDRMTVNERVLWDGFAELVPFGPARALMFDISRVRYRDVSSGFPEARRRELAAEARAFVPDPYAAELPTYQRMVMLHALYDIALSFEHSPLLGCTAFGLGPEITQDGHAVFARVFDFEAAEVFDKDKVVFIVHEDGKIPFASVAWPGFVGVVTGMNAEGVAVAVHGGRSHEPSVHGVPVAFSLREVLASARDTREAVRILSEQQVMVSHLVFVGDAAGHFAVVERAPGVTAHVRGTFARPGVASVTNHFEGPLANDPRDSQVRATTTTLARRTRIDELLAAVPAGGGSVGLALGLLRDHGCSGAACQPGDRRAIDAFIATHGVVADLTARALWVSEGPRLSGRFVKLDPAVLVRRPDGMPPALPDEALETLPEDAALHDGRYVEGRARAGGPLMSGARGTP
jgi:isopenicillin-N N-acyltransferase like protein